MPDKEIINVNTTYENISSILSDIEKRVIELNQCSSDDFIMLNKYLKNQYSRIEKISNNVTSVFELHTGRESISLSDSIRQYSNEFHLAVKCYDDKFSNNSEVTEQVISYMNLMYIPFKNYVQNVVTLTFLTNSLKFNLVYQRTKNRELFNKEIEEFQKITTELKRLNSVFDETSNQIKTSYEDISEKLRVLQENNLVSNEVTEETINIILKKLNDKFNEGKIKIPELKRKKNRYSENVNKIIINLQYSDIIRQKIEHISEAHREIIERIDIKKNSNEKQISQKFLLHIKDISDLQIAQLIRTNTEYQNAVKIISEKFVEIGRDINDLAADTLLLTKLKNLSPNTDYDFYDIKDGLEKIKTVTGELVNENSTIFDDMQNIVMQLDIYQTNYHKFQKASEQISSITQNVLKKAEENFENEGRTDDIIKQFKSVNISLENNNNDISKYYKFCKNKKEQISVAKENNDCPDLFAFSERIGNILDTIKTNNTKIQEIIFETARLEKTVSSDINNAVKEIKYYIFYESAASDIINKLKDLYDNISYDHEYSSEKVENLQDVKQHYTMKSERIIHDEVASGISDSEATEEDDDDIEFF